MGTSLLLELGLILGFVLFFLIRWGTTKLAGKLSVKPQFAWLKPWHIWMVLIYAVQLAHPANPWWFKKILLAIPVVVGLIWFLLWFLEDPTRLRWGGIILLFAFFSLPLWPPYGSLIFWATLIIGGWAFLPAIAGGKKDKKD